MPTVKLDCIKDGEHIQTITLQGKPIFTLGRNAAKVDVPLLHDSISREHAVILFDEIKGALIVDLGSQYGVKVNGV
jgi:pSer/pThr/pTyr-binding forkhead associated (FHA) protein